MLTLSATQLAAGIREGRWTSRLVVEAHIAHIEAINPTINALVFPRFEQARLEADTADQRIADARQKNTLHLLPPLLGVPCTIKENFALRGAPNSAGLPSRRTLISTHHAPAVERLLQAGAIPLGVTNTSELCMWMESYNTVYGRTNNPYDPERTVGGSSGGEGAIVGAGCSPFGLGSDIGGSIRMPAFFNGVFGHKCSPGLISNEGQFPLPTGNADELLSTGPLCRKAEDLEPLLRILMGEKSNNLQPVSNVDISQLRVFTLAPDRGSPADNDQQTAQAKAVRLLQEAGAKVATLDLPLFDKSFDLWSALISTGEGSHFANAMFGSTAPWHPLWEMGKLLFRRSSHTLPLVTIALVEQLPHLFPKRTRRFVEQAHLLKQQLEEALGDDGVLVTIPYPESAPLHGMPILPPLTFGWTRCAIFNALRVPSTAIPMGLNAQNLPTGVQIVAKQNNDHLSLACALTLEKLTGGWIPPHSLR